MKTKVLPSAEDIYRPLSFDELKDFSLSYA